MYKTPAVIQARRNPNLSPTSEMEEKQLPEKRSGRKKWWIIAAIASVIVIAVVLGTTLGLLLNNNSSSSSSNGVSGGGGGRRPDGNKPYWPGWDGINNLVFFGDSMTSVRFAISGDQPSEENPIGNPTFPGVTSSIGSNWVGFMTGTYNESFIRTIDLGGGGATVDGAIFRSKFPGFRSFKTQVETDWIPNWTGNKPSSFDWQRDDTLFISFFGLNDCRNAYFQNKADLIGKDIDRYMEILGKLYSTGSRNFLVLLLSPLERAPNSAWNDEQRKQEFGDLIEEFNGKLTQAVEGFSNDNPDAAVFLFDTHSLYNELLDDPCSYQNTCAIKETKSFCAAYANERSDPYYDSPDCAYPLDQYFWINGLHPIFRVHNATSQAIVEFLKGQSWKGESR